MATTPKNRGNLPRPRRTLVLFLAAIIALYGLVALINLDNKKGDDSAWKPKLGLDLEGGTRITLEAKANQGKVTKPKLDQARDIIDQRVNATGVTEAEVTTQSGNQVIIEIPGERKAGIVDQVGKTAQMRFRLVWTQNLTSAAKKVDTSAEQKIIDGIDWSKVSLDQMIKAETTGLAALPKDVQPGIAALQKQAAGFVCTPGGVQVEDVSSKPLVTCDTKTGEVQILSPAVIEGSEVKSANQQYNTQTAQWTVQIKLKGKGSDVFETVTKALTPAQNRFAIVLDGEIITAPSSQAAITNGVSEITGSFTPTSSKALADQLKYGALPLTFGVNGSEEIGPSLAGTQLHAGLLAGVIGLILVVVYCLFYYRGLGLVIIGSLLVASALTYVMVLLLGKGMGFTLTLPGIAGLIVAIGITADSFIVFFERIRDEVRDGKSLRLAVEAGWVRARSTILAADAVSILAALTLFIFAIGVVRGFAFALGLTTLIDVFVVFLFTKPLVSLLARTKFFGQGHKLSGLDAAHLGIEGRKVSQIARTAEARTTGEVN
ncbi:protein translocase subunit SecD [Aeromicrobium ginsengisoli]|uniref:Protein translocase subunit SecD n=1 Tax=Aeromicrobium ginsengisoli TaxID=363867 RepID=A0A5M4FI19_9ACTN|nr:protein translocase subunit SecD [Aeromicrobium ginsengisoli]KAA1399245.1 protein translocase subunit SecD [Aeromicrobium ginsengisoli]